MLGKAGRGNAQLLSWRIQALSIPSHSILANSEGLAKYDGGICREVLHVRAVEVSRIWEKCEIDETGTHQNHQPVLPPPCGMPTVHIMRRWVVSEMASKRLITAGVDSGSVTAYVGAHSVGVDPMS